MHFKAKLLSPVSYPEQYCKLEVQCSSSYGYCQLVKHTSLIKLSHEKAGLVFLKITNLLGNSSLYSSQMPFGDNTNIANQGTCHIEFCLRLLRSFHFTRLSAGLRADHDIQSRNIYSNQGGDGDKCWLLLWRRKASVAGEIKQYTATHFQVFQEDETNLVKLIVKYAAILFKRSHIAL